MSASRPDPEASIRERLATYERAVNSDDAAGAAACYTDDGMFIATHVDPAVGSAAIESVYGQLFSAIELRIRFTIHEVVVGGSTLAYARTESSGTQRDRASDTSIPEANRELFIFRPDDGVWKIARYMFQEDEARAARLA